MKIKQPSFLQKTFDLLCSGGAAFRWSDDGSSFGVVSVREFCDEVLPLHFKHCNFASFVRQLNLYSFHKVKLLGFQAAFTHPSFHRDRPQWLSSIERKQKHSKAMEYAVGTLSLKERDEIQRKLQELLCTSMELEERTELIEIRTSETLAVSRRLAEDFALHSESSNTIDRLLMLLGPVALHLQSEQQLMLPYLPPS